MKPFAKRTWYLFCAVVAAACSAVAARYREIRAKHFPRRGCLFERPPQTNRDVNRLYMRAVLQHRRVCIKIDRGGYVREVPLPADYAGDIHIDDAEFQAAVRHTDQKHDNRTSVVDLGRPRRTREQMARA